MLVLILPAVVSAQQQQTSRIPALDLRTHFEARSLLKERASYEKTFEKFDARVSSASVISVKFRDDAHVLLEDGQVVDIRRFDRADESLLDATAEHVLKTLASAGRWRRRSPQIDENVLLNDWTSAENALGEQLPNPVTYFRFDVQDGADIRNVVAALNGLGIVEVATPMAKVEIARKGDQPRQLVANGEETIPPMANVKSVGLTGALAFAVSFGVVRAWDQGITGRDVNFGIVVLGRPPINLKDLPNITVVGNLAPDQGTQGILNFLYAGAPANDDFGQTGLVFNANFYGAAGAKVTTGRVTIADPDLPAAIEALAVAVGEFGIVSVPVVTLRSLVVPNNGTSASVVVGLPADYHVEVFDIIKTYTDKNRTFFLTCGDRAGDTSATNGLDLSRIEYPNYPTQNSGAFYVQGGFKGNYGRRFPGRILGPYGHYNGDLEPWYTNSTIIGSSAALVQSAVKQLYSSTTGPARGGLTAAQFAELPLGNAWDSIALVLKGLTPYDSSLRVITDHPEAKPLRLGAEHILQPPTPTNQKAEYILTLYNDGASRLRLKDFRLVPLNYRCSEVFGQVTCPLTFSETSSDSLPAFTIDALSGKELKFRFYGAQPGKYIARLQFNTDDPRLNGSTSTERPFALNLVVQATGTGTPAVKVQSLHDVVYPSGALLDFGQAPQCSEVDYSDELNDYSDWTCAKRRYETRILKIVNASDSAELQISSWSNRNDPFDVILPTGITAFSNLTHQSADRLVLGKNGWVLLAIRLDRKAQPGVYSRTFSFYTNDPFVPQFTFRVQATLLKELEYPNLVLVRNANGGLSPSPEIDFGQFRIDELGDLIHRRRVAIAAGLESVRIAATKVTAAVEDGQMYPLKSFLKLDFINGVIEAAQTVYALPEKLETLAANSRGLYRDVFTIDVEGVKTRKREKYYLIYRGRPYGEGPRGLNGVYFGGPIAPEIKSGGLAEEATSLPEVLIGGEQSLGKIKPGQSSTTEFRITNKGTQTMYISDLHVTGGDEFEVTLPERTVAPGAYVAMHVRLSSAQKGTFRAGISYNADTSPSTQPDNFFTFDVVGEVCDDASCTATTPGGGGTNPPPPPPGDGDRDIFFEDSHRSEAGRWRSGAVIDFSTNSDYANSLPYNLYLRVAKTSGTKPIKILGWKNTTVQGGGIFWSFTPDGLVGDGKDDEGLLVIAPNGPTVVNLEMTFQYEGSQPQVYNGPVATVTLQVRAGKAYAGTDSAVKFHLENEYSTVITTGAILSDGTLAPHDGGLDLGVATYRADPDDTAYGFSKRRVWVCNDGDVEIVLPGFEYQPGITYHAYKDGWGWRRIAPKACEDFAFTGYQQSGSDQQQTYIAPFSFFISRYPSADGLATGARGWLPVKFTSTMTPAATPRLYTADGAYYYYRGSRIWVGTAAPSRAAGKVLYVENIGTVDLNIRDFRVVGTGFGLVQPPKKTIVKPGEKVPFRIRLLAAAAGSYRGSVEFNSNDPNGHFKAFIEGRLEAKSQLLSVTQGVAKTYNGGTYDASTSLRFTVKNLGTSALSFGPVRVPEGFTVPMQLPPTLDGGQSADFAITRDSGAPISPDNVISFETSDPDNPIYELAEVSLAAASDDYASTAANTSVFVPVLLNDQSGDGDALSLAANPIATAPAHGTAVKEADGIRYTPASGYSGSDSFTYRATSAAAELSAAVYVTVGGASLVAIDDRATTYDGRLVDIAVLANDRSLQGLALRVSNPQKLAPQNGTVELLSDGRIRYRPYFNVPGTDSFRYEITDGSRLAEATVSVEIIKTNLEPIAVNDEIYAVKDTSIVITPLANDYDPESGAVAFTSRAVLQYPANGTLTRESFTSFRYTPNPGFLGLDTFRYEISDGHGAFAAGNVSIAVELPNASPVARNDSAQTVINRAVTIDVVANDSDPDGHSLALLSLKQNPAAGTAAIVSSSQIRYTPSPQFAGVDRFVYEIHDGHRGTATAEVTVTVNNQAPAAAADAGQTNGSTAIDLSVTANDSDPDGDPIKLAFPAVVTTPASGATVTRLSDTQLRYVPVNGFVGADAFTYSIVDSRGATATGTVTVTIVNRAPLAIGDVASTTVNTPVTIDVVANDTDADGHTLTVQSVTAPQWGGTAVKTDGRRVTYTPPSGFVQSNRFTYTISDGKGGTATGTVDVSIVNRPPVATNDSVTVPGGVETLIAVLSNDSDPEGGSIRIYAITRAPLNGTATYDPYGGIRYQPKSGYTGGDSLEYEVRDNEGAAARATVSITVTADTRPDTPPVASFTATCAGRACTFDASASTDDRGIATYSWKFGNQQIGAGKVVPYTYPLSGSYAVELTVKDTANQSAKISKVVTVTEPPPNAVDDFYWNYKGFARMIPYSFLLQNDTDPANDPLTVVSTDSSLILGTLSCDAEGCLFTPPASTWTGRTSFKYTISDGRGGTDTAVVTIEFR